MPSVIIADDEEFVRYFLKTVMDSLLFDVAEEVDSGDKLVYAMRKNQPDILLLDINMPNLTGLEFLKEYSDEFKNTCIIILTSATYENLINEVASHGARGFLRKDTTPERMVKLITECWDKFSKEKNV